MAKYRKSKPRRRSYRRRFSFIRRRPKFTLPLAPVGGIAVSFGSGLAYSLDPTANSEQKMEWWSTHLVGYDFVTHGWNWQALKDFYLPIAVGLVIHKGASMLGVNRMLAQAKVPIIRI